MYDTTKDTIKRYSKNKLVTGLHNTNYKWLPVSKRYSSKRVRRIYWAVFRHFVGIFFSGGFACRRICAYRGQHTTEKCGHTIMPRVEFRPTMKSRQDPCPSLRGHCDRLFINKTGKYNLKWLPYWLVKETHTSVLPHCTTSGVQGFNSEHTFLSPC
jgi:hypothetical protein